MILQSSRNFNLSHVYLQDFIRKQTHVQFQNGEKRFTINSSYNEDLVVQSNYESILRATDQAKAWKITEFEKPEKLFLI